jgi:hypothetical protein
MFLCTPDILFYCTHLYRTVIKLKSKVSLITIGHIRVERSNRNVAVKVKKNVQVRNKLLFNNIYEEVDLTTIKEAKSREYLSLRV